MRNMSVVLDAVPSFQNMVGFVNIINVHSKSPGPPGLFSGRNDQEEQAHCCPRASPSERS